MNATTVTIDLAKDIFELAFADEHGRVLERKRLKRSGFARAFDNLAPMRVVMEACGSAHYWARRLVARQFEVRLLPAQHVAPYRRGNKNDRNDTDALLLADRCAGLKPVPIKTADAQGIQALHRLREHHKQQRTASLNIVRGLLREFGITIPLGALKVRPAALAALEDGDNELPMALRHRIHDVLEQIVQQEKMKAAIDNDLADFAQRDTRSQRFMTATGVGVITATAVSASMGELERFPSGRHFSSSLGLTPREFSSGTTRRLGKLTRRGDIYLRTLLIHGGRSVLRSAATKRNKGVALDAISAWALQLAERVGHNKAACAVANKLARRLWATEHHRSSFDPNHVSQKG